MSVGRLASVSRPFAAHQEGGFPPALTEGTVLMSQSADELMWDLLMEDLAEYLADEERAKRSHGWCCECGCEHREVDPTC